MNIQLKYRMLALVVMLTACKNSEPTNVEVKNNTVNIAYEVKGKSDTAVLFVHGWCIDKTYWKAQMDFFEKRYKVVALDLSGHGESGKQRSSWTIEEYANDVIAVINALQLDKVILVGHSMGGEIILQVTGKIPGKIIGFIGIDNFKDIVTGFTPEQKKGIDDFFASLRSGYDTMATIFSRSVLFPPDYADTASVNRVISDIRHTDTAISIATLESLMTYSTKDADLLQRLQLPVHLVVSDYTPVKEDVVKKYCNKGLYVYTVKGTGHYPMIEKPGEFNYQLQLALNDIGEGK